MNSHQPHQEIGLVASYDEFGLLHLDEVDVESYQTSNLVQSERHMTAAQTAWARARIAALRGDKRAVELEVDEALGHLLMLSSLRNLS